MTSDFGPGPGGPSSASPFGPPPGSPPKGFAGSAGSNTPPGRAPEPGSETEPGPASGSGGSTSTPSKADIRPRATWYWIGTAILVLGIAGATGWFIASVVMIVNGPNDYQRVSVPGQRTVQLTETGTYTIYGEAGSGHVRLALVASDDQIDLVADRLGV